jgi:hypothetical protein
MQYMAVARDLGSRFRLRESRIVSLVDIACTTRLKEYVLRHLYKFVRKMREDSSALGKITISCSLRSPSDTVITSTPVAQRHGLPPLV